MRCPVPVLAICALGTNIYITKTVYYEVSCGIVVGWVVKATVDRGLDPAGTCVSCRISLAS
jgi:hypothetical protein